MAQTDLFSEAMKRRQLLINAGILTAGTILSGCGAADRPTLRVELLKGSIPPQLLQEFERSQAAAPRLILESQEQLSTLFDRLGQWHQPSAPAPVQLGGLPIPTPWRQAPVPADLCTLGDYWLTAAIQRQWIQPLNLSSLSGWPTLPRRWQQLVTRDETGNLADAGEVWAAPYRMSQLAIAYDVDRVADSDWQPQDWGDLWRPELQGRLALPDQPRLVLGLVLKHLGATANPTTVSDLAAGSAIATQLAALHRQVKLYTSDTYLQPLVTGDVAIAVGWSTDILPVTAKNRQIKAIIPASGTLLSADLWVQPRSPEPATLIAAQAELSPFIEQWIDFYWNVTVATQLSTLSNGTSPVLLTGDRQTLPPALQTNELRLPTRAQAEASEFLTPLTPAVATALWDLWQAVRQGAPQTDS